MSKIDELRAAHEAAIETDVDFHFHIDGACDADDEVALMRFWQSTMLLMPQLLETVEALETCKGYLEKLSDIHGDKGAASAWAGVTRILESLK